jgi:hypothetical protein
LVPFILLSSISVVFSIDRLVSVPSSWGRTFEVPSIAIVEILVSLDWHNFLLGNNKPAKVIRRWLTHSLRSLGGTVKTINPQLMI